MNSNTLPQTPGPAAASNVIRFPLRRALRTQPLWARALRGRIEQMAGHADPVQAHHSQQQVLAYLDALTDAGVIDIPTSTAWLERINAAAPRIAGRAS